MAQRQRVVDVAGGVGAADLQPGLGHVGDPEEAEVAVQRALHRGDRPVELGDDRPLHQDRQAPAQLRERVDVVLLVELHHLRVELLRVLLVLLAQLGHLRRDQALLGLDAA